MNTHFDVHGMCRAHHMKACHMQVCNDNLSNQHDPMQENIRQLREKTYSLKHEEQKMALLQREKTYSLKQEEQKIAILQSFLRYKKYQLEESARNLDEKRIEIANWEYSLYNKAKKLQEKEQWLENKNEILNKKTQQLIEKEKILYEENRSDILFPSAFKEAEVPDKKFALDNNDTIWNEISKMKNPRMDENNQYSFVRYDSKPAKVHEDLSSNVEKCKSDAFSLDELEKNLVFIEKLHSSSEINDSPVNKIEMASSPNAIQKSEENASYDPLGYSKGRRYLPEHIKYWLDKRDKNAL